MKKALGPPRGYEDEEAPERRLRSGHARADPRSAPGRLRAALYYPTAALALEIVSPGDETWERLPFYAAHHVDELLIIDGDERAIHWLALDEQDDYRPVQRSRLIELGSAQLAEQIDWP